MERGSGRIGANPGPWRVPRGWFTEHFGVHTCREERPRENLLLHGAISPTIGKAAAQVMVLFAERGVKEGQEITWSYGDSYRSHRKEMGYKAGTKADPNAITPQQARTAFARYCEKIDVTKEELAWNFGCISASQSNEQEAVLDSWCVS